MEKYSKILIYIFLISIINLGISFFVLYKVNKPELKKEVSVQTTISDTKSSPLPQASSKPITTDSIQTDLTQIKAEIRSLREILGISGSFEELSNLIKSLNQTDKP